MPLPLSSEMPSSEELALGLRFLCAQAVDKANSGHPGLPLGMADVMTILWREFMVYDPTAPNWPNRDRFILSAGHGSILLYTLLYLTGYPEMTLEQLKNFRQWASITAGHPEFGHTPGIETTTGPLGQGIATAVGIALAQKMWQARYPSCNLTHKIYVLVSDGDLMEGISQEALSLGGHWKLDNLIVLYDDNNITIDGPASLSFSEDTTLRFQASGWQVLSVDGHNHQAIRESLQEAQHQKAPLLLRCRTTIGYGAPSKAGNCHVHGAPLGHEELHAMKAMHQWTFSDFSLPDSHLKAWRSPLLRHEASRKSWESAASNKPFLTNLQKGFETLPESALEALRTLKEKWATDLPAKATRQLSQEVLQCLTPHMDSLVGGSADLMGSTNTKTPHQTLLSIENFKGEYIPYGVREHAMGAIMNGLSLSGFRPYGGTFLVFSDYLRPALRLSALMQQPVIYVFTHDSIGLGEDGPTHQPIEHLASLRAIPNLNVLRPADGLEVVECWTLALENKTTPTALILSRQNIKPYKRPGEVSENQSARGAYVLGEALGGPSKRCYTFLATGTEVGLAMEVREKLHQENIPCAVISVPCTRLFALQDLSYQQSILAEQGTRVVLEAASPLGWHQLLRPSDMLFTLDHFGASAPAGVLYEKFGFSAESITGTLIKTFKERS